jgi:UDP-N-acetylglucosamine:LPS N-acetylglucosamine transferase
VTGPALRVLVLSADVGEGHLAAAHAITEGLVGLGAEVTEHDGLIELGWVARHVIRDGYRLQLRLAPWSYSIMYALFNRFAVSRRAGETFLRLLGRRRLLRLIARADPDVVVSTHPALTSVLGGLRRRRRLAVPLVAPITDLADYAVWSHRGADAHLVMHPHAIAPVERVAGRGSVTLVHPLVAERFRVARDRDAARDALDLDRRGSLVAVSGGGWGVGDLAGGVRAAIEAGADAVVAVAGRNAAAGRALTERFAGDDRVRVWGFTARMDDLLRAADLLIHSTGGVTSLEALSCGCPMIAYGASAGHIRVHNRTMAELGLIAVADSRGELSTLVRRYLVAPPRAWSPPPGAANAAAVVAAVRPRVQQLPLWRLRLPHAVAPFALGALLFTGLSTDEAYSVVARPLELAPTSHVATTQPAVGLVVVARRSEAAALARRLAGHRVRLSFAVPARDAARTVTAVTRFGDDVVPELPPAAPVHWLRTRAALRAAPLLAGRRAYLTPVGGLSFGQYLLARSVQATPIAGQWRLPGSAVAAAPLPAAGDVVVVTAEGSPSRTASEVLRFSARLSAGGLTPTSLSELLAPSTRDRTTGERSSASAQPTTSPSPARTPNG